ncbi:MAG: low-complexity tail membrane protein [Moorea sp. SIO2B7]|nr:low-complexity tail membrane protein [Moorena sp. SIO2B7]
MRSFWSEPFLWIHLAGLAMFPLLIELVWLALAVGDPLPVFWLEFLFVALVGIVPVFWMQWNRPFDIFSILIVALKPEQMTLGQRQILSLFKTKKQRLLTAIAGVLMLVVLWQLYRLAPVVELVVSPFFPQWRFLGLLMATVAFLVSNLFLQVPLSVLGILFTSEQQFAATEPCELEKIPQEFTIFGFQVGKILPFLIPSS